VTYAKAIVAAVTQIVGQLIALGLLSGTSKTVAEVIVAAITGLAVYLVPNSTSTTPPPTAVK